MLNSRIAALRQNAGLSQAELASRLGVSTSAVGMYEQGRRTPSLDIVVSLSKVFNISTDFLLTGVPESTNDYNSLSRDDRLILLLALLIGQ